MLQIGSSKWQKHRGGLIDEEQWDIMLKDLKGRGRAGQRDPSPTQETTPGTGGGGGRGETEGASSEGGSEASE